jgi:putative nucleotidyltransferase with HDIG domain
MLAPQLLRTRVARRILGLFLVCAVLPVATFAILAYRLTANRLESDARAALRQDSKTAGMIVMDRLQALASELGSDGGHPSYAATAVERAEGRIEALSGAITGVPALSKTQQAHLSSGRPVVAIDTVRATPWIFIAVPTLGAPSGFPRRWGMVAPAMVIGVDPGLSPAPDGTDLCILDDKARPLYCPNPRASALAATDPARDGQLIWEQGDSTFLMARWSLFLASEFAASPWTIALSTPQSRVLVPLGSFRRTFLLGVALAAVLVFVLSHVQLRKRMTPLAELEAGVHRLSAGDFTSPVMVRSDDEFEMLATSFNGMAAELRDQFMTLNALSSVDVTALETRSASAIATAALRCAPGLLGASRAAVAFGGGDEPGVWTVLSAGPDGREPREERIRPTVGEVLHLEAGADLLHFDPDVSGHSYFGPVHFPPTSRRVVFPLRENGRILAALVISREGPPFPAAVLARGRQLADQLAVGLSNVALLGELDALSHGSLLALARTIDAASPWTAGHSERVTQGALEIARRLELDRPALDQLRRGGLLHDIGKIGVPASILDKPGRLTPEERTIIEMHPVIGAEILKPISAFHELRPLVLYHHEVLDGSGYPDGLTGDAIPALVRILTVADVFDALVSDRPYRAGLSSEAALAVLRNGAGIKYEERCVRCLEDAVRAGWSPAVIAAPAIERAWNRSPAGKPIGAPLHEEVFS